MRSVTPIRNGGGVSGASPGARFIPAQLVDAATTSSQQSSAQRKLRRSVSITTTTTANNNNAENISSTQQGSIDIQFDNGLHLVSQQLLGKGGFARVLAAKSPSGESYALKVCEEMSEVTWRRLHEEVRILQMFQGHQNIVHLYAASRVGNNAYLAMERCVSSSLHDLLNNRELSLPEILWIGHQLVTTIHFIHEHNCIHRDLKPQNILFDYEGNVKVIDFGLSSRVGDSDCSRKTIAGTAVYMAPEMASHYIKMLEQQHGATLSYGREVDLWSFGVVMFVMATRMSPYWHTYQQGRDAKQRQRAIFDAVAEAKWQWPGNFTGDAELMDLVEQLLSRDRGTRPTLDAIMGHQVWKRRPYSCPLSLLRALRLVDSSGGSSSSQQQGGRAGSGPTPLRAVSAPNHNQSVTPYSVQRHKIPENEVIRRGIEKIEQAQTTDRANIIGVRAQQMALMDEYFTIGLQELSHRSTIVNQHQSELLTLRHAYRRPASHLAATDAAMMMPAPADDATSAAGYYYSSSGSRPSSRASSNAAVGIRATASRAESIPLDSSKPLMSDFRRQRATSVMLVPSSSSSSDPKSASTTPFNNNNVTNSHNNEFFTGSGTRTAGSATGTRSSQARAGSVMPQYIPKCLNGHQMAVECKLPFNQDGWWYEILECNGCNQQYNTLSKSKCMFRCTRCDFDICYKCIEEQRPVEAEHVCLKCSKVFVTAKKMRNHFNSCRGPSTSPSPAREDARNTLMWDQAMMQASTDGGNNNSNNNVSTNNSANNNSNNDMFARPSSSRRSSTGSSLGGISPGGGSVYVGGAVQLPPSFDESHPTSSSSGAATTAPSALKKQQREGSTRLASNAVANAAASSTAADDSNLSPIQAAIARRHRERAESERIEYQEYQERLSVFPQPGEVVKPQARKNYTNAMIDYRADDYVTELESSITRSARGLRSKSRSSPRDLNDAGHPMKFHRSEDDAGDAPAVRGGTRSQSASRMQVHLQSNAAPRPHDVLKPPALQGGGRKGTVSAARARSRQQQQFPPSEQEQQQQQRGANNDYYQAQQQQQQSTRRNSRGGDGGGGGRSFFNGPAEMIPYNNQQQFAGSRSRTPQPFPPQQQMMPGQEVGGPRGRRGGSKGVLAPSPGRQGPINNNNNTNSSRSRGRDVSRPADLLAQPNRPPRLSAGEAAAAAAVAGFSVPHTAGMMLAPGRQQQQQQQSAAASSMMGNGAAGGGGGAFLALPQRDDQRAMFIDEFLRGSWVRHYAFATNDVAILYYSVQPGRFGALFQNNGSMATVVIDIHSKLVLVVSSLRGETTNNRSNDPLRRAYDVHVETEYDEDARVMPLMQAQEVAGPVIGGILDYVNEITRMKAEGHVPVYVPAAFVHNSGQHGVPADTKFTYVRRVFPDPDSSFTLFRLSNLRSQIISTAHPLDIRWQSDRRNHVGCKYYVYQNGEAQPFSVDTTGILSRVERVLTNAFSATGR